MINGNPFLWWLFLATRHFSSCHHTISGIFRVQPQLLPYVLGILSVRCCARLEKPTLKPYKYSKYWINGIPDVLDLTQWLFIWTTCTFAWGGSHMHDVITSMWSLVPWQLWLIWLRFSSRKALNVGFFFSNFVYVWVLVLKQNYRNDENESGPLNQSALIPYHIIWILILIRVYKQIQGLISLLNFSNYLHASPTL